MFLEDHKKRVPKLLPLDLDLIERKRDRERHVLSCVSITCNTAKTMEDQMQILMTH